MKSNKEKETDSPNNYEENEVENEVKNILTSLNESLYGLPTKLSILFWIPWLTLSIYFIVFEKRVWWETILFIFLFFVIFIFFQIILLELIKKKKIRSTANLFLETYTQEDPIYKIALKILEQCESPLKVEEKLYYELIKTDKQYISQNISTTENFNVETEINKIIKFMKMEINHGSTFTEILMSISSLLIIIEAIFLGALRWSTIIYYGSAIFVILLILGAINAFYYNANSKKRAFKAFITLFPYNQPNHKIAVEILEEMNTSESNSILNKIIKDNEKSIIKKDHSTHFATSANGRKRNRNKLAQSDKLDESSNPGPKIFICHTSEDNAYATDLFKKLLKAGFQPWIDNESLKGGDDWNRNIRKVIKEIDYFIILHSKALEKKTIGYVNREINLALDRLGEFRPGIRFIIPVKIDESQLIEDFKKYQCIDLTELKNIDKLINTIKIDFKER